MLPIRLPGDSSFHRSPISCLTRLALSNVGSASIAQMPSSNFRTSPSFVPFGRRLASTSTVDASGAAAESPYDYLMKQGMDDGALLKQSGARFARVMSKVAPLFAQLSPALLCAVAAISSGGSLGAPGIPAAVLGEEVVKQVLVAYPIGRLLDKLIGKKSSTLTNDEAHQVKAAIESLTEKISQASRQNLAIDSGVAQFATALINGDQLQQARQCIEGLDSKLGVVSAELATRLDQIREELAVMNQATLPTIQAVLDKGVSTHPEFFRRSGPAWVDFQEGYVYERPEVADIIQRLKQENVVAIKGAPASGKSSILRNVGYRLAAEGADVWFLELKTLPVNDVSEIWKIRHGFIFVDDAHLNLGFVESLLLNRPNAKIVIACRNVDLRKAYGPTTEYKLTEYLDHAVTIRAVNAAEQILERFEEKSGPIPHELRTALTTNDLWVMAWQLKSIASNGRMDEGSVLKTVKEYVENIKGCTRPENVLLPASAFFEHETAVRKPFLDSFSEEGTVKALEAQGEVVIVVSGGRDYVLLHHSEVAAIYQRSFGYYEDFGASTKRAIVRRFDDSFGRQNSAASTLTAKLLNIYVREYPTEIINLAAVFEDSALASEIIRNNLEDISVGLKREAVIARISRFTDALIVMNRPSAKIIVRHLDIDNLVEKIENGGSILAIGTLLSSLRLADRLTSRRVLERLNVDRLVERIDKEPDLEAIRSCFYAMNRTNGDIAKRVVERLDLATMVRKLDEEADVDLSGCLVGTIADASRGSGIKVVKRLDVQKLVEKTVKAETPNAIWWGILMLRLADEGAAKTVLEVLGPAKLMEKIQREHDVRQIGKWLELAIRSGIDIASRVAEGLNRDELVRRLEQEEHAYDVGECLARIHRANASVATEIAGSLDVARLTRKVENEIDVEGTRDTLDAIAEANVEVANRIVEEIDIGNLAQKLDNEEDVVEILRLFLAIHTLNQAVMKQVVERLDIEGLVKKVEQEEDAHCFGMGFLAVAFVDPDVAERMVAALGIGGLVERIDKAGDVRAIGECIHALVVVSPLMAEQVVGRLNTRAIAEKIGEEIDTRSIGILLEGFAKQGSVFENLLDAVGTTRRREVVEYLRVRGITLGEQTHLKKQKRKKED